MHNIFHSISHMCLYWNRKQSQNITKQEVKRLNLLRKTRWWDNLHKKYVCELKRNDNDKSGAVWGFAAFHRPLWSQIFLSHWPFLKLANANEGFHLVSCSTTQRRENSRAETAAAGLISLESLALACLRLKTHKLVSVLGVMELNCSVRLWIIQYRWNAENLQLQIQIHLKMICIKKPTTCSAMHILFCWMS